MIVVPLAVDSEEFTVFPTGGVLSHTLSHDGFNKT
jgi:hypothetical protein